MYHHKPFSLDNLSRGEKKILRKIARPFRGYSGGGGPCFVH